jgi:Lar family restriction alleviation protein
MKLRISTCDGKYLTENNNGILTVLRHGKPWNRNFNGDGYVLSLVQRIEELEEKNLELIGKLHPTKWFDVNEYYREPTKIKSCPFCESRAKVEELQDCTDNTLSYIVRCEKCNAETAEFTNSEMAVLAWNNRMTTEF